LGAYDLIEGNCPFCNKKFSAQTKLGKCQMISYTIGDYPFIFESFTVKNFCEHCKNYPTVIIKDGFIIKFSQEKLKQEIEWGKIKNV